MTLTIDPVECRKIQQREYTRRYRLRNPEKIAAYAIRYRTENRNRLPELQRRSRVRRKAKNPRIFADQMAKWRRKNPEKWKAIAARAKRKRYRHDPVFRAKQIAAARAWKLKHHPPKALIDLTGLTFSRLSVLGSGGKDKFNKRRWRCVCICGGQSLVTTQNLKDGTTRSCGCLIREHCAAMGRNKPRPPKRDIAGKRAYWNARNAKRRRENAIECRIRCRIHGALKAQQCRKTTSLRELLGTDIAGLRQHLESLFKPGMSWSNYGFFGWHIDHKRPCASFDLSDTAQQRQCFHYTNLQPLWWRENLSKKDKTC